MGLERHTHAQDPPSPFVRDLPADGDVLHAGPPIWLTVPGALLAIAIYWTWLGHPAGDPEEMVWNMWAKGRADWQVYGCLLTAMVLVSAAGWRTGRAGLYLAAVGVALGLCLSAVIHGAQLTDSSTYPIGAAFLVVAIVITIGLGAAIVDLALALLRRLAVQGRVRDAATPLGVDR